MKTTKWLIGFILLTLISSCTLIKNQPINHDINSNIWFTDRHTFDTASNQVTTYFTGAEVTKECPELVEKANKFFALSNNDVLLGKYCNKYISLVNFSSLNNKDHFKQFTAIHESFHIAVQLANSAYPILVRIIPQKSYRYIDEFNQALFGALLDSEPGACRKIESALDAMPAEKRNLVVFKALIEWPAEYYAKYTYFGNRDDEYLEFRKNTVPDAANSDYKIWADFYTLFLPLSQEIDKYMPTKEWQKLINHGDTMLDIYMRSNGCKTYSNHWLKGRITSFQ